MGKDDEVDRALERGRMYRSRHLYAKAEETFLGILQRHPEAARAHQELGYLYFEDLTDYVSALYHLERYMKLRPGSQPNDLRSDVLEQVRAICQQEIAKEVSLTVLTAALQKEIESLTESNKVLRLQVANLTDRMAQRQPVATSPPERSAANPPVEVGSANPVAPRSGEPQAAVERMPSRESSESNLPRPATQVSSTSRAYTIRSGDTLFSLARRYGVTVQQLLRANPGVQADNLQIGQRIVIPESR